LADRKINNNFFTIRRGGFETCPYKNQEKTQYPHPTLPAGGEGKGGGEAKGNFMTMKNFDIVGAQGIAPFCAGLCFFVGRDLPVAPKLARHRRDGGEQELPPYRI